MKKISLLAFISVASAEEEEKEGDRALQSRADGRDEERSLWRETDPKYKEARMCESDDGCDRGHVCVGYRWAYNNQFEATKGCFLNAVCTGTGAFWMFDERKIQWFCNEEQKRKNERPDPKVYGLKHSEKPFWREWEVACRNDKDCNGERQQCVFTWWDAKEGGSSWGYGTSCYDWGDSYPVCKGKDSVFATQNIDYYNKYNKEFSHYIQNWCPNRRLMDEWEDWTDGLNHLGQWGDDEGEDYYDDEEGDGGDGGIYLNENEAMKFYLEDGEDGMKMMIAMGGMRLAGLTTAALAAAYTLY